ncbi:MAG: alpha/beta fold hydrolase, partial [Chloroflexota bacterium]
MTFEDRVVRTADGLDLPAWWIPAAGQNAAPAVVLVHGWESARHRTLPNAQFLHAIGYHVLTLDVRGHGANPAESLPVSAGEFGADALAGVEAALADPTVTAVAVLGHSMGSVGAALAAAAEPRVAAAILTATPADPYRMTRQTFRLAHIRLPDPIAVPLAWLTTRVYLRPRRRSPREISASAAIARY